MKKLIVFSLMVILTVAMPVFGAGMTYTQSETPPALNVALEYTTLSTLEGTLLQITPANNDGVDIERANGQSFTTIDAFELGAVSFKNPPNTLSFGEGQVGALAILDGANNCVGGPYTCLYPNITNGHWTVLTLDAPVSLAAATQYKFVFTLIGPISENLRCWGDRNAGYAGGQMMTPAYEAGTFPVITTLYTAGRDMYFVLQEYVDTGVNSEPFVDAGSDAAIYLQSYRDGGNIVIDASSADDGNILPLTYDWSVIGDDTNVSFVAIDVEDPNVTFSALGSYELQLEVYDGELYAYDTVVITVIDNSAPIVEAGADKLLYLTEGDSVVLDDAFVTDDGEPNVAGSYTLTTTWEAVPETGVSFDPYLINTTATFTETGTYVLTLTADDTEFAPFDAVTVTVKDKMLDSLENIPTDDSYVDELEPELTHGLLNRFRITALEGERNYYYAKFDVSDYNGGNVRSAILQVRPSNNLIDTIAYSIEGNDWDESTITWNNDTLVWGDQLGLVTDLVADSWYEIDVSNTDYLTSDGFITLGLKTTDATSGGKLFYSKDSASSPRLIIEWDKEQAGSEKPVDGSVDALPWSVLSWRAANGASAHKVYFGTSPEALPLEATVTTPAGSDPNIFEYDPVGDMAVGSQYFWRVDEVIDGNEITGEVWEFTVKTNSLPIVDAGENQTLYQITTSLASLDGEVSDDGMPEQTLITAWSVLSVPEGSDVDNTSFSDFSSPDTDIALDVFGEYVLQLSASDDGITWVSDMVTIFFEEKPLVTVELPLLDDTYVIDLLPDNNYGADERLRMVNNDSTRAYLKFDSSPVTGIIKSAELSAYSHNTSSEMRVYAVSYGPNGEWFEGVGTQDDPNNPTGGLTAGTDDLVWGDQLGIAIDMVDNVWYDFDATGFVIEIDGTVNIGLKGESTQSNRGIDSKESNAAVLTVTFDAEQAYDEFPSDGSTDIYPGIELSWKKPVAATAQKLLIGTDPEALVDLGDVGIADLVYPEIFVYTPEAELVLNTEYFWQVNTTVDGREVEGEIWSFTVMEFHPDIPCLVSPADLSVDVVPAVVLQWLEGESAEDYDLYFNINEALVIANDPSVKVSGVATPYTVENLDLETTYYWTIVATAAADGPWPAGEAFSFTTADYALIDSFEDGYWVASGGADANSVDTYADDGDFSMEVIYDDAGDVASVVTKTFAVAQDLTSATGRKSLQVNFKGVETNDAEEMYVALSDGTSEVKIIYDESADIIEYSWENFTEWNIDLADFAPVDLSAVTSIAIGLGDGIADGRVGTVYIDNIRVYVTRCISDFVDGDIVNGDCTAGPEDLALMAKDWLAQGETVTAGTVSTDGLLVQFDFEETAGVTVATSSVTYDGVNTATAAVVGAPVFGAVGGITGLAVDMASAGYLAIDTPAAVFASVDSAMTISLWCYGNPQIADNGTIVLSNWFRVNTIANNLAMYSRAPNVSGNPAFGTNNMGGDFISTDAAPELWRDQWNHYAFVVDAVANFQGIYCNGVLIANNSDDASGFAFDLAGLESFEIGGIPNYHGLIDDFRVYDRALDQAEVLDLAGEDSVEQPLVSNADANEDGFVDLGDFAEMASVWLDQVFWP